MGHRRVWLFALTALACTDGRGGEASWGPEPSAETPDPGASVAGSTSTSGGASTAANGGGNADPNATTAGVGGSAGAKDPTTGTSTNGFVRRQGKTLVIDGKPLLLKGISLGNEVWTNSDVPWNHHAEADFARLQSWGMNVVRFCMNYATFESDAAPGSYKQSGWEWLDANVAWAKAHQVYLVLNIHVPQGGFQPGAAGNALWDVTTNQDRLLALWQAIAKRYANEPIIAGYDLLNEPDVSSSPGQWQQLATRLVNGIREVDRNHLLVVERTNAVNQKYSWDGNMNWFLVPDDNVMYTFHFYGPFAYTHQGADWAGLGGTYGSYPDAGKQESLDRGAAQYPRTKQYLEAALQQYADFGDRNDVPLLLGEFGAIAAAFDQGRGGEQWTRDMVSIAREKGMSFIYHTYHEDNFGVFKGYGTPVDPNQANTALLAVASSAWKQ